MTIQFCILYCQKLTFSYCAIQNGNQCRCAWNGFGKYGIADSDQQCDNPCQGNSSQNCGGSFLNSIYSTSYNCLKYKR